MESSKLHAEFVRDDGLMADWGNNLLTVLGALGKGYQQGYAPAQQDNNQQAMTLYQLMNQAQQQKQGQQNWQQGFDLRKQGMADDQKYRTGMMVKGIHDDATRNMRYDESVDREQTYRDEDWERKQAFQQLIANLAQAKETDPSILYNRELEGMAKKQRLIDDEVGRQREGELQNYAKVSGSMAPRMEIGLAAQNPTTVKKGTFWDDAPVPTLGHQEAKNHFWWNESSQPARDSASTLLGLMGQAPQSQVSQPQSAPMSGQQQQISFGDAVNYLTDLKGQGKPIDWDYVAQVAPHLSIEQLKGVIGEQ